MIVPDPRGRDRTQTSTRSWGADEWREPGPGAPRSGAPVPAPDGCPT